MEPNAVPQIIPSELADDILEGADAIAEFLFGPRKGNRRKIYYLASRTRLPLFRFGSVLCARKSVLREWIAHQENRVLLSDEMRSPVRLLETSRREVLLLLPPAGKEPEAP